MRWLIRCAMNTAKASVPFHSQLRRLQYRFRPYPVQPERDAWTIEQGLGMIDWIAAHRPVAGAWILDIGSGWSPLIPIIFSMAGAAKIYLTDLNRLMTLASLDAAFRSLRQNQGVIEKRLSLSPGRVESFLAPAACADLDSALAALRLEYLAPCDCQHLSLPAGSIDLAISRAVLEHIPPPVIQNIFIETERLLKPLGVSCHIVDNSDHWQHNDRSLSRINFLRYSDRVFALTHVNSLDYQNRLRHSEYLDMLRRAKLDLLDSKADIDPQTLADAKVVPLHPRFQKFTAEDLATMNSYLLSQKPA